MKPLDPASVVRWIHPSERPSRDGRDPGPEFPSIWGLGCLSKRERAHVHDVAATVKESLGGDPTTDIRSGSMMLWRVKFGLRFVEGFPGWESEEHPFDPQRRIPTDAFLDTIPDDVFEAISTKVSEMSTLTKADAGKSSPESTDSSTDGSPASVPSTPAAAPAIHIDDAQAVEAAR